MTALRAIEAENNHGGARPGAGRKPKALRFASELAAAEERMMSALPTAIEALETAAKDGDVAAARYLCDRAFGRVQVQVAPVAEDTSIPYSETDLERDETTKAYRDSLGSW